MPEDKSYTPQVLIGDSDGSQTVETFEDLLVAPSFFSRVPVRAARDLFLALLTRQSTALSLRSA